MMILALLPGGSLVEIIDGYVPPASWQTRTLLWDTKIQKSFPSWIKRRRLRPHLHGRIGQVSYKVQNLILVVNSDIFEDSFSQNFVIA